MEQSVRSDSTPVSAGHDTTGRHDPDHARDAAVATMLTGVVETGSAVAAAIRLHEEAYGQRLYAETYRLPDADARAGQERGAFRRLLHTQLVSDADRQAYALAVIGRAAGVYGSEFENSGRSAWMPTAYRNLAFGEYAPEADGSPSGGPTLPPTPAGRRTAGASPVLTAMVDTWQALAREINDGAVTDEEAEALGTRHTEMQIAICRFPATTVADLLAKVPVFQDEMQDAVAGLADASDPAETLSGAAWLGLFRDFERLSKDTLEPAEASSDQIASPATDPIFAAIDECRRLDALHDSFFDALAGAPEDHPDKANQHAAHDASWRCWRDVVLTTVPQTAGGCQALASYAGAWFKMQGANDEDAETVLALIARSPMLPSPAPSSDLAEACVEQVKRLRHWDANPGSLSEAEGDAEMDRWGAVTRRAIEEPSAGPRDLASKACLSLHDMDRFLPERTHPDDLHRLLRVILRETIDMGGGRATVRVDWRELPRAAEAASAGPSAHDTDRHAYAFHGASTELRLAARDLDRLSIVVDEMPAESSAEAVAKAKDALDAASDRQDQAWRDLFKIRPRTNHQLWLLLRDVAQHFEGNQGIVDEPDVFGALVGAADSLRLASPEITAQHDLTVLTIAQLGDLADVCRRQAKALYDVSGSWFEGPLTAVLDGERDRISLLGSMASAEIERRTPTGKDERNERLETLIKADLAGNGYIEPALLAEAVAAWGTR